MELSNAQIDNITIFLGMLFFVVIAMGLIIAFLNMKFGSLGSSSLRALKILREKTMEKEGVINNMDYYDYDRELSKWDRYDRLSDRRELERIKDRTRRIENETRKIKDETRRKINRLKGIK